MSSGQDVQKSIQKWEDEQLNEQKQQQYYVKESNSQQFSQNKHLQQNEYSSLQKEKQFSIKQKEKIVMENEGSQENQAIEKISRSNDLFQSMSVCSDWKNQQNFEKQNNVLVMVSQGQIKNSTFSKQIYYIIDGSDDHGKFYIQRRYKEFIALRNNMIRRWPGCFIPGLIGTSKIKNELYKKKNICLSLTYFIQGLATTRQIYYKEEVQLFLRSENIDMEEMFEKMPHLLINDVIGRFKSCFQEKDPNPQNAVTISIFSTSLHKIINNLKIQCYRCLNIGNNYQHYIEELSNFGDLIRSYEKLNLAQFTANNRQATILFKDTEESIDHLKSLYVSNPFYEIYILMEQQQCDALAFLQVLQGIEYFTHRRDKLQASMKQLQSEINDLALGNKSIRTITSRRSISEIQSDLQSNYKKMQMQRHSVIQLYNLIESVLASQSIQLYRNIKIKQYHKIIFDWIQIVKIQNPSAQTIWKQIHEEALKMYQTYN